MRQRCQVAVRGLGWSMNVALPATAAQYFGSMVQSYDSLIARAVPRYGEMTDRLVEYLACGPGRESILELGCGTGNLSMRLVAAFPDAAITFVDAAPDTDRE